MVTIGTAAALPFDNVELKANLPKTIMPIGIKYYSIDKSSTGKGRDSVAAGTA